jgi:hypothetical protein
MKKQKNIPVSKKLVAASAATNRTFPLIEKANGFPRPTEETLTKLNEIAKEYPFCVNFRQANTYFLL